jgi:hypothetical protein
MAFGVPRQGVLRRTSRWAWAGSRGGGTDDPTSDPPVPQQGKFNISGYASGLRQLAEAGNEVDPAKRSSSSWRRSDHAGISLLVGDRTAHGESGQQPVCQLQAAQEHGLRDLRVFPYLGYQPKGHVKEVHVGATCRVSSAHLFTERSSNGPATCASSLPRLRQQRPRPWAAESYKVVDPTTVDLKIRDGMKWHDGNRHRAGHKFTNAARWKPPSGLRLRQHQERGLVGLTLSASGHCAVRHHHRG